ncbi:MULTISPECIES: SPOR domain-containing protein [unclassified Lentimicrobium]|uniref:SPOR domain-containing protein n=1 Tax=unclassified Lentimicrobium TaxID=2677434 RepID=UPI0015561042|nr:MULTISPECIES: SPOR domain-containing protein [unclassified Lentimicrobium]NPD45932.1 hypothetical protein [Lentimicrobium sp. S6]NPD85941.1 hypothetical protein [Lentimicrobium sp. L6]
MNYKLFLSCLSLVVFSMLIAVDTYGQRIKPNRWFVSGEGGVSVFFGDIKRYDYVPDFESPSEIQPMFSLNVGKEFSPVFGVRGQFLYGKLSGHKKSAKCNFEGTVFGAHALVDFNLIYLLTKHRYGDSRINILASLGVGYINWDSKLYSDNPFPDGTYLVDENSNGALSFPGALSIEYLITKNISVGISGMLYVVSSDEIDAKPGGIKMDMINYNSIGLVYRFDSKRKASRKNIKYRLDASIYEPTEKELPIVGGAVVAVPEGQNESAESVSKNQDLAVENGQAGEGGNGEKQLVEEYEAVEKTHEYQINHELEKEAMEKETWASKGDDVWPGINFSVQVAATKNPRSPEELKEQFGIKSRVFERFDGEWYRYSVGHYDKMWRAKELRNTIRSTNGIEDAFIVVYRDNERISLEEALNYAARTQSVVLVKEEQQVSEEDLEKVYPLIRLDQSIPSEGILIGVQILSVRNDHYPLGVFSGIYGIEKNILVNIKSPWHKLIAVGFDDYENALDYQDYARSKGFIDAFVVAFKDGKRISISTLKSLTNGQ